MSKYDVGEVLQWAAAPEQLYVVTGYDGSRYKLILIEPGHPSCGCEYIDACKMGKPLERELTEQESVNYALAMMGLLEESN